MKYFIMLIHPNGRPMPIINEDDQIELFSSYKKAEDWTKDSDAAQAWGYIIYPWDP